MNGALTYKDLEMLRLKAATLDKVREHLRGRIDNEAVMVVSDMVEQAYQDNGE